MSDLSLHFQKYQGAGNDFIIVNDLEGTLPNFSPELIRGLCSRAWSIGADGLLWLSPSERAIFKMSIFNSDGHPARMCGNGLRVAAAYAVDTSMVSASTNDFVIESPERLHNIHIQNSASKAPFGYPEYKISSEMGPYKACELNILEVAEVAPEHKEIIDHIDYIDTGAPHLILVCKHNHFDWLPLAKSLRHHPRFSPEGVNVSVVVWPARNDQAILIQTFEKGVEDLTQACGTATCAAAVSWFSRHTGNNLDFEYPSTTSLQVTWSYLNSESFNKDQTIFLKGPAQCVFKGKTHISLDLSQDQKEKFDKSMEFCCEPR